MKIKAQSITELNNAVGRLSEPSKMAGTSWSISAFLCGIGSIMAKLPPNKDGNASVCSSCYARKGNYLFKVVKDALDRRWKVIRKAMSYAGHRERFISNFVELLERKRQNTIKRLKDGLPVSCDARYHRWFDSGDLAEGMLPILIEIAERSDVVFWLPTRERSQIIRYIDGGGKIPSNLSIRISSNWNNESPINIAKLVQAGCHISGVHDERGKIPDEMKADHPWFECPAWKQDGECRNCRACYPTSAKGHRTIAGKFAVSYPLHVALFSLLLLGLAS